MPSGDIHIKRLRPFLNEVSQMIDSGFDDEEIELTLETILGMEADDAEGQAYRCPIVSEGTAEMLQISAFPALVEFREIHIHGLSRLQPGLTKLFESYA